MSKLRSIDTSIWCDTWFEDLCSNEKLLFIYFITNEKTNMLGVYEISIKKVSFETGINKSDVTKYLKKFESDGKIRYVNNRVILLNYIKHQKFNFNMKKSAIEIYNSLPDDLKIVNINELPKTDKGFETLCKGFGMVSKREIENEYEEEVENEYEEEEVEEESSDSKNLNVFSSEVFNCFDSIKIHFPENVLPTTQKTTDNWLDVIDKLNRIDGLTFEEIEIIVKWVRNDNFWKQNFLSITKLRKKNSEGIHYWKVFVNKIQAQHGQKQSTFEAIANWGNDYNPDWSDKAGN